METCSSSEDLIVKTRKPYTITKQRERWTDEEHNRFLEALKLYGRAWQRIEEHIGTKTAVQIRSHAQKFFTKLEKEALSKGLPLGQAHDIDIPPPRPKRKPSNPYPRKTCIGGMSSSAESIPSLCPNKEEMLLKKDSPIEKPAATESLERTKGASENGSQSEVLTLFKDAPCTSLTSVNKSSGNSKFIRGFVPLLKEIKGKFVKEQASPSVEENNKGHYTDLGNCKLDRGSISSQRKLPLEQTLVGPQKADKIEISSKSEGQCSAGENNDSCGRAATCNPSNDTSIPPQAGHCNPDAFKFPSVLVPPEHYINALMSSIHQIPCYTPCAPFQQCQDAQGPFINMSSTFSNLIISSLIHNPAAHAAASLAASFWPSLNGNSAVNSFPETCMDGIPATPLTPSPSLTAIAAATVAAATAWWATHGLFPLNHPLHTALTFASVPATTIPTTEANQTAEGEKEDKDYAAQIHSLQDKQVLAPQSSDVQMAQLVSSKILPSQLSDSDDSGKDEMSHGPNVKASGAGELVSTPDTGSLDKARNNKKQDRSSCGSNTPSSSDETDMMLENPEETKEEVLEEQINHLPSSETNSRRSRSSGSTNDSWREVSEEGRLAFQALFSREVLPQSFSPPYDEDMEIKYGKKEKNATTVLVDLNSKAWPDAEHDHDHGFDKSPLKISTHSDDSVCMSEAGHGKLKIRRTGFKPYKRCSAEAKENHAAGDETSIKRIRLGEEAST